MSLKRKSTESRALLRALAGSLLFFTAAAALILLSIRSAAGSTEAASLRLTQEALERAAVTCYAIEGRYPPSLQYLEGNYGVSVDETRYYVSYESFAENLMPQITVLALQTKE